MAANNVKNDKKPPIWQLNESESANEYERYTDWSDKAQQKQKYSNNPLSVEIEFGINYRTFENPTDI